MVKINFLTAARAFVVSATVFACYIPATAGTFAVATTYAAQPAAIAQSTIAAPSLAADQSSKVVIPAGFAGANNVATASNFSAATTTGVATSFATVNGTYSSPTIGQLFTGSFGASTASDSPSAGGGTNREEIPNAPEMGAATSVSDSIANATGAAAIPIDSYAATSATNLNNAIGPVSAVKPAGAEYSAHYQSYSDSQATDVGPHESQIADRVCLIRGIPSCSIGSGLKGVICNCKTQTGTVDGISQ